MQNQIPVDTATLKRIIERDLDMVMAKTHIVTRRLNALGKILDRDKQIAPVRDILDAPGITEYLETLRDETALELSIVSVQVVVLRERLAQISSNILVPGLFNPAN